SRCGVFAKTDIQPLLNQGAAKEDVAASIFQAVVNQTISGLACGKPIRGRVAFLGGPLHFLPQLRRRFRETLNLDEETGLLPENAQLYAAWGTAFLQKRENKAAFKPLSGLIAELKELSSKGVSAEEFLPALFADDEELRLFRERHGRDRAERAELKTYKGRAFLGVDAGSTTSKMVLTDDAGRILYSCYENNRGEPVDLCVKMLRELYAELPEGAVIAKAVVTGYGEQLLKAALRADLGEVETMAHYKAAEVFLPGVGFILDIGGQDMKAITIRGGVIENITLNEACSSGCGSFVETFAQSLGLTAGQFADLALSSRRPKDLGSRCTVFMNSMVKQAQKEGVSVADISAGLSYAVIKNALYKVIKIRDPKQFGTKILAQGGTFYNEAVLRAFEKETGCLVTRPDIAGLMGAYGAALIAKERYQEGEESSLLTREQLADFKYDKGFQYCTKCTNHCLLTVIGFGCGRQHVSGNRCELGAGGSKAADGLPNLVEYKYKRLFKYQPLPEREAHRGKVGIPRVLNMYENYPFWHTFFSVLGFRVVLSPASNKKVFEKGMESIPSEAVCYPAKLAHGHLMNLLEKDLPFIFYPCVVYEKKQFAESNNNYNCPVVSGYPDVLKNNVEELLQKGGLYLRPFITFNHKDKVTKNLYDCFAPHFGIPKKEIAAAVDKAYAEMDAFKEEMRQKGEETLAYIREKGIKGVVLCGRPYHADPEINHGLVNIISGEGMAVLTEDSVAHLGVIERPLRVRDQWAYTTRLYAAASFVAGRNDLELVQLISFGCGVDAVNSEQVAEILHRRNKIYTAIKIDEGGNLGAARIRIRSLKVAMEERARYDAAAPQAQGGKQGAPALASFTKEMKKRHTILAPQLSPIHFQFVEEAFRSAGYDLQVLHKADKNAIDEGLKYANNDLCYPCILVVGQLMQAVKSGQYDLDNLSLIMTQTGGQCRATNYVPVIRKALEDAGLPHIPVIAMSLQGLENSPGFKLSLPVIYRAVLALNYGDLLMKVLYRTRPYEAEPGSADRLHDKWAERAKQNIKSGNFLAYNRNMRRIIEEFDALPLLDLKKPRVGLVGEILVKFAPDANNDVVKVVEEQGGEAVMPGMLEFFLYIMHNTKFEYKYLQGKRWLVWGGRLISGIIGLSRAAMNKHLRRSRRFDAPIPIKKMADMADKVVSLGHQAGEGWLLTAEMIELIHSGAENIICMQPFACLPNHITGRGVLKELKRQFPQSNVVAVDYDPGASEANQLNRIKLMMSSARIRH
ncbi:MAG: acyl-CoA dehydratase activase-related protein, partial [Clostridiales bacterium]|nr:acyl-CoA dehydratase activase-related protein [Clostridiales bacterium]